MTTSDEFKSKIDKLCQEAVKLGATQAVPIPVRDVVIDPRTRLKCQVPLCAHYGDLMCPPNMPPVAQFQEQLGHYNNAILLRMAIPAEDVQAARNRKEKFFDSAPVPRKRLHEIVHRVEALCLEQGFFYAAGFIGGSCPLCPDCVRSSGQPCRHPFQARPAMEAMGIDVVSTAQKAGIPMGFGKNEGRSWIGLVLVN